jgi:hypothetical protein
MRASSVLAAFAAGASIAAAAPIEERSYPITGGDLTVLNYALTLEYLERKFYMEGLAQFNQQDFINAGFPDPFYDNLKEVYYDEMVKLPHSLLDIADDSDPVAFLAYAISSVPATPVQEAIYKFPFTDRKNFVGLASVLEGVGVSAYFGAAAYISLANYLTVAGSILTVEACHSSYIRAALTESPFPKPFDTPLDFNQVYSLASQFIVSIPSTSPPLPFKPFAPLTIDTSQYNFTAGSSSVTFDGAFYTAQKVKPDLTTSTQVYAVFFSGLDKYYVQVEYTHNGDVSKLHHIHRITN